MLNGPIVVIVHLPLTTSPSQGHCHADLGEEPASSLPAPQHDTIGRRMPAPAPPFLRLRASCWELLLVSTAEGAPTSICNCMR